MEDTVFTNSEKQEEFLSQFSLILTEDARLDCLMQFAAPFTGGGTLNVQKGTEFRPIGLMRDDALYLDVLGDYGQFEAKMMAQVSEKYPKLADRFAGFIFFITTEQLISLPISFSLGDKEALVNFMKEYRKRYPDPWHRPGYEPRQEVTEDGRIITIL